ncbi:MAG: GNAT family N-acetyltransferase [Pseudomonadota bacterium]
MSEAPAIRPIQPADAPAVHAMMDALNIFVGEEPLAQPPSVLAHYVESGRLWGFIAEIGSTSAGYAIGYDGITTDFLEPGAYMSDLYVTEALRGTGIGRKLVDRFAAHAKSRGATHIWWTAIKSNADAHAAYMAMGATTEEMTAHALVQDTFEQAARRGAQETTSA